MLLNARVEVVPSGKLFATMLLHIPYCEKLIFGQRLLLGPPKGLDPGLQTKISLDMFKYLLHLCLHTKIR